MYLFSISLYLFLGYKIKRSLIQQESETITRRDVLLSLVVVLCNSAIFVMGFLLWKNDVIIVKPGTLLISVFELFLLIILMDFAMYLFHRIAHSEIIYRYIHKWHHEHESTNAISLFVLHPIEALGFGSVLVVVLMIYPFSASAIGVYLLINLLWGTIGHLNVEIFPERLSRFFMLKSLGTVTFHNIHHQSPKCNFGFYTLIWDKLFGTFSPEYPSEFIKNSGRKVAN